MERQRDFTYSCSPRTARGRFASILTVALYVVLVAGIWLAYLWVAFSVPTAMAPG